MKPSKVREIAEQALDTNWPYRWRDDGRRSAEEQRALREAFIDGFELGVEYGPVSEDVCQVIADGNMEELALHMWREQMAAALTLANENLTKLAMDGRINWAQFQSAASKLTQLSKLSMRAG